MKSRFPVRADAPPVGVPRPLVAPAAAETAPRRQAVATLPGVAVDDRSRRALPAILTRTSRALGADAMLLLGLAHGKRTLRSVAASGLEKNPPDIDAGCLGRAVARGRTPSARWILRELSHPRLHPDGRLALSAAAVPVRGGRGAPGCLVALWRSPKSPRPAELLALRLVGEVLGAAMAEGRERAAGENLGRAAQLRAFYRLSRLGSVALAPDEVGRLALKAICRTMGFVRAEVWLLRPDRKTMWRLCAHGPGLPVEQAERRLPGGPFTRLLARAMQGLHHPNIGAVVAANRRGRWPGLTSIFGAPIRARGQLIGFLYADRGGTRFEMTATELELQSALSCLAGDVIISSLDRRQESRRQWRVLLLNRVSRVIRMEDRVPVLLRRVARIVRAQARCRGVLIRLFGEKDQVAMAVATAGPGARVLLHRRRARRSGGRPHQSAPDALLADRPILVNRVRALPASERCWPEVRSVLAVPIRSRERLLGQLRLEATRRFAFEEEDVPVLAILGQQIGHAIEKCRVLEALRRKQADLRALSAKLENVLEDDRRRIAQELHDEIGQSMTAAKINLGLLQDLTAGDRPEVSRIIGETAVLMDRTIAETRRISMDLRPSMLDELGLLPTLRWYAKDFARRTGIRVMLKAKDSDRRLHRDHETFLYRFVQEGLTNVARHARAQQVAVSLSRENGSLQAEVRDDGIGMQEETSGNAGIGLLGLRERIERAGGRLRVDSSPGKGTRLIGEIPVDRAPEIRKGAF